MSQADSEPLETNTDEADDDLAETMNELAWRVRQCWADSLNILALEGRIALRSLLLLVVLVFCFAGLLAGAWLVLVLMLIYGAMAVNTPMWVIAIGVIILHLLAFAGLAQQLLALGRLLSFPRSRRAASTLLSPLAAEPKS